VVSVDEGERKTWEAILGGLLVAFRKVGIESDVQIISFKRWLEQMFANHGFDQTIKLVKIYCKWLRWYAACNPNNPRPKVDSRLPGLKGQEGQQYVVVPFVPIEWLDRRKYHKWFTGQERPSERTREILLQLSLLGRGLPALREKGQLAALEDHKERLQRKLELPKWLHKDAHAFGKAYARTFAKDVRNVHTSLSTSASLEFPRSKGGGVMGVASGLRPWLEQVTTEAIEESVVYNVWGLEVKLTKTEQGSPLWRVFSEGEEDFDEFLKEGNIMIPLLLWAESDLRANQGYTCVVEEQPHLCVQGVPLWLETPKERKSSDMDLDARVAVIGEDGAKARVITCECDSARVLGHILRDCLYGHMIENDSTLTANTHSSLWTLVAKDRREPDKNRFNKHLTMLHSIDLTAATDTFDLALVHSLVDGIVSGLPPRSKRLVEALRPLIDAPRNLFYPEMGKTVLGTRQLTDESDIEVIPKENHLTGILMGTATSYSILNVWSRWIDYRAMRAFHKQRNQKYSHKTHLGRWQNHVLKGGNQYRHFQGDDAIIADMSPEISLLRRDEYRRVGNIIGDGADIASFYYGEFCEEFTIRKGRKTQWKHLNTVKIRPLLSAQTGSSRPGDKGRADPLILRGDSLTATTKWLKDDPEQLKVVLNVHWRTNRRFREMCQTRHKTQLYLPWFLGGLNYPHPRGESHVWRKMVKHKTKMQAIALGFGEAKIRDYINLRILPSARNIRPHGVEVDEEALEEVLSVIPDVVRENGVVQVPEGSTITQMGLMSKDEIIRHCWHDPQYAKYFPPGQEPFGWFSNKDPKSWRKRFDFDREVLKKHFRSVGQVLNDISLTEGIRDALVRQKVLKPQTVLTAGKYLSHVKTTSQKLRDRISHSKMRKIYTKSKEDKVNISSQDCGWRIHQLLQSFYIGMDAPEMDLLVSKRLTLPVK
jgi:hypothetical protein